MPSGRPHEMPADWILSCSGAAGYVWLCERETHVMLIRKLVQDGPVTREGKLYTGYHEE